MINPSLLLRRTLQADAVTSGAMAVSLTSAAGALAPARSAKRCSRTGLFLVVYAALVGWLGSRAAMAKPLVWAVIADNALWARGSLVLLVDGPVAPNLLGEAFVALQALAVGVLAELQYVGLRRSNVALTASA